MPDVRLIDANALRNVFDAMHAIPGGTHIDQLILLGIKSFIDEAPTIDAVPVVRCRECWKHQTANCPMFLRGGDYAFHDGFCHLGAKMDAKETNK